MKKIIVTLALVLITPSAYGDVYVKVDANGNATSGPLMCDAETCATGSEYSRLTLSEGERYVLQGTGNAGIGNNTPNATVKVDENNTWTVTRTQVNELPVPVTINNEQVTTITMQSTEQFNPVNPIAVEPTPTPETSNDTTPNKKINIEDIDWNSPNWYELFLLWFADWYLEYLTSTMEG